MKLTELKVARIGNSRGVRLPAGTLRRYRVGGTLLMEERADGILLRPAPGTPDKLSWEETARAMAASQEDWGAWDAVAADGLDSAPWAASSRRVAESRTPYASKPRGRKPS